MLVENKPDSRGSSQAIQQHIEGAVFFMDGRIKCGHDN